MYCYARVMLRVCYICATYETPHNLIVVFIVDESLCSQTMHIVIAMIGIILITRLGVISLPFYMRVCVERTVDKST